MSSDYSNLFNNEHEKENLNELIKNQFLKLSEEMLPTLNDITKLFENIEIQKNNISKIEDYLCNLDNKFELIIDEINNIKDKFKINNNSKILKSNENSNFDTKEIINNNLNKWENIFNIKIENIYEELNQTINKKQLEELKIIINKDFNYKIKLIEHQIIENNKNCLNILKNKINQNDYTIKIDNISNLLKNYITRLNNLENKEKNKLNKNNFSKISTKKKEKVLNNANNLKKSK